MVDSLYHLIGLFFFNIPLLYCYIIFNLRSSIILCLSSKFINLSLSISSSFVFELFCGVIFETVVILSAILLPIQSPVASAVF